MARVGVGVLVAAALVTATIGGVVFGGRPSDATHPSVDGIAWAGTGGEPLEVSGLGNVPSELLPPPSPPPPPGETAAPGALDAVEQFSFEAVDGSRATPGRGDEPAHEERILQTVVRYPVARDGGPYPLVVFAHGYATSTAAYGNLLDGLAAQGFVVAAPEFPLTSTAIPLPVGDRDAAAQVGDVRFVISAVQDLARASDSPLFGRVTDGPVGIVGHSDGGVTAAAAAFAGDVRDDRIGGAVVLSGAGGDFGGSWFTSGSAALLAIHGDSDGVNPFGASSSLYARDQSGAPRYLVSVTDAGHTDAFVSSRTRPAVSTLIATFLRASLRGDAGARSRISYDASVPGVLELVAADDR